MPTGFCPFAFDTCPPEQAGIPNQAIQAFIQRLETSRVKLQGYMIWRDGHLAASEIAAPYRMTDKRHAYSVSKSFTSTAIGIACDEGLLSVEDAVTSFFPELLPETVSENLAAMKVRHLLSMNTGHDTDTLGRILSDKPGWVKKFLALPVEHAPGTHFMYNSGASYLLSAILTQITGMTLPEYLRTRLFNPLGMTDVWWEESPDGIAYGGWGLHVSPEDMLKLGILYLNGGVFAGRRVVSQAWVQEATSYVSDNSANGNADWKVGYGYQLWRCQHDSFRADGAFGQYIVVSPDKRAVTVIISETNDLQAVLDAYWDTLYGAMAPDALPAVPADRSLKPFLPLPDASAKKIEAFEATLEPNPFGLTEIAVRQDEELLAVRLHGTDRGIGTDHAVGTSRVVELVCGAGRWEYNRLAHSPLIPAAFLGELAAGVPAEIAAAWGWDGDGIHLAIQVVTTPHGLTLTIGPERETITITRTLGDGTVPIKICRRNFCKNY